ncbi:DUF4280 domain-containing protein [Flavobacterium sp. PS2]|uniref:DUF4280 domain-containing protein n=1 Tax=Flavobacterium sp. PS2 TaxID=3384157 RepID=UPI00390C7E5C
MSEKHIVVHGATCKCKFSVEPKTDKLKVKTQTKHYANDQDGAEKLIASTKDIGQTLEKNTFGKCKKQPTGSDYLPCQAQITKWSGFYEKMILSNQGKVLLEDSKGTCPMGAPDCIEITKHGQVTETSEQNFKNANPMIHNLINPMVDVRDMNKKQPTYKGMEDSDAENINDIYINKTDASVLINYGNTDGDIRMIAKYDFQDFNEITDFNDKNNKLKSASIVVTVDNMQIQGKIQEIHRLTNKTEQQVFIVLDRTTAKIIAVLGLEGIDGETEIDSYTIGDSKPLIEVNTQKYALLGQVHTHNLMKSAPRNSNQIGGQDTVENGFGTSEKDKVTAKSLGINIYALDSWNYSSKNAEVSIGRVTPKGVETKKIGKTYGKGEGSKIVNIGLECLNLRVGR